MTIKLSKTYKPFDIVVIPFPFSDKLAQKKRPALVLSSEDFNAKSGHLITAMITTAKKSKWPNDSEILEFEKAGLPVSCLVRMKFFTVDQTQILRKSGSLSKNDQKEFLRNLRKCFGL